MFHILNVLMESVISIGSFSYHIEALSIEYGFRSLVQEYNQQKESERREITESEGFKAQLQSESLVFYVLFSSHVNWLFKLSEDDSVPSSWFLILPSFFDIVEQRYSFQRIDGCREDLCSLRGCLALANGACLDNQGSVVLSREYVAARKIQTAYRAHVVCHIPC